MRTLVLIVVFCIVRNTFAQYDEPKESYTLEECINYALENSTSMKNARLDEKSANAKVLETIGIGLPQVNASISAQHSPQLQRFFGTYSPGSTFLPDSTANRLGVQPGEVFGTQNPFLLPSSGNASLRIDQILFNGSYLVGLQATKVYKELSTKERINTEGDVEQAIAKAFYNVLINEDRSKLISANVKRVDTLFQKTKAMYEAGFVESIDLDRIKVSLNNAKTEESNMKNYCLLSRRILKFQMNYPLDEKIVLKGSLTDVLNHGLLDNNDLVDYNNRPDYNVALVGLKLQKMNLKNIYSQALPQISLFANLGYSTQSANFGGLFRTESNFSGDNMTGPDKWFNYSTVGISAKWSVFTGLQRNYQIQQQKIVIEKMDNEIKQFENLIEVEVKDAHLSLKNALGKFDVQKENKTLAEHIYQVSQKKYEQGVGSNMEVLDAENSLKQAQTNYYNALFEAILAKIDLNNARGIK